MRWQKARRFEECLQQAAQGKKIEGEFAPLIHTVHLVSRLGELSPPETKLAPGRQRFVTEVARLEAQGAKGHSGQFWATGRMRLVGTVVSLLLLMGLVLGVGQATAYSLPGGPFYTLKLAVEETLLGLTTKPQARANLAVSFAEERLDEITALMDKGAPIDDPMTGRAKEHLAFAVEVASQADEQARYGVFERLTAKIRTQRELLVNSGGELTESQKLAVQDLLRAMEEAREQLLSGKGEPGGEQRSTHMGTPAQLTPPSPEEQSGPGSGAQATEGSGEPNATEEPGPGPKPTDVPAAPIEPNPTGGPGSGPGPNPTDDNGGRGSQPNGPPRWDGGKPNNDSSQQGKSGPP